MDGNNRANFPFQRLRIIPYQVPEAEYNPAPAHFPEGAAYPDQYADNGYPPPDPLQPQACPPQLQAYPLQQYPPQGMPPPPPVGAEVRLAPHTYLSESEYNTAPPQFHEGNPYPNQYAGYGYPPPDPPQLYPPHQVHHIPMPPLPPPIKDDYYRLSIMLSLMWCILCAPILLVCTLPALFFSKTGREAVRAGDMNTAKQKFKTALYCNIASMIIGYLGLLFILPVIIVVPVLSAPQPTSNYNFNYN